MTFWMKFLIGTEKATNRRGLAIRMLVDILLDEFTNLLVVVSKVNVNFTWTLFFRIKIDLFDNLFCIVQLTLTISQTNSFKSVLRKIVSNWNIMQQVILSNIINLIIMFPSCYCYMVDPLITVYFKNTKTNKVNTIWFQL